MRDLSRIIRVSRGGGGLWRVRGRRCRIFRRLRYRLRVRLLRFSSYVIGRILKLLDKKTSQYSPQISKPPDQHPKSPPHSSPYKNTTKPYNNTSDNSN